MRSSFNILNISYFCYWIQVTNLFFFPKRVTKSFFFLPISKLKKLTSYVYTSLGSFWKCVPLKEGNDSRKRLLCDLGKRNNRELWGWKEVLGWWWIHVLAWQLPSRLRRQIQIGVGGRCVLGQVSPREKKKLTDCSMFLLCWKEFYSFAREF